MEDPIAPVLGRRRVLAAGSVDDRRVGQGVGRAGTVSTSAWAACQAERSAAISLGVWPCSAAGAGSGEAESAAAATAFAATGAAA